MAYDPRKALQVCEYMSVQGISARQACIKAGVDQSTFNDWLNKDAALAGYYARAREDAIEHIADEAMRIADEPIPTTQSGSLDSAAVAKQKLQIDTRKWLLSKMAPKRYGDKLELSGDPASPLITKIERVIVQK